MQRRSHGWTIVELMIALSIAAMLAIFAHSGYRQMQAKVASHELREAILSALLRARSEAAGRERTVFVCPSADQRQCLNAERWHEGWLVLADRNGNGRPDHADTILFSHAAFGPNAHAVSSHGRRVLKFHPNGGNAGSNVTFTFCDRRGAAKASAIAMSNTGNYRAVTPAGNALDAACAGFDS